MGCGPSKDTGVAAGNTVSSKSLLEKNSDGEPNNTSAAIPATATATAGTTEDETANNTVVDVQEKDVGPTDPVVSEEEREEKSVAVGSPDRYFSSRKDEEVVEGVTASMGFVSTSPPPIVDGESVAGPSKEAVNAEEEEADEKAADCNGGEEIASKQDEGTASSKDSNDLKEASLVETKEIKVEVAEKENVTT